ncbi:hypothetical protein [Anaerocolumna xylanovorans]|uniref:Uncharacterized protein n=1 Tax=Anaerocolumna xylanovorans DSM 12503 TaxID=1121345 RepID=A0A1M7YKA6_9FIRM|nr:hypothetical protein [Anaerocolumna xylanovorans]SHO52996.1 hypothetical protein SAMN02745217_03902 [Anaerocolumna xylanovorans DSM 12503]
MKNKNTDILSEKQWKDMDDNELEKTVGGDSIFRNIVSVVCQEMKEILKRP